MKDQFDELIETFYNDTQCPDQSVVESIHSFQGSVQGLVYSIEAFRQDKPLITLMFSMSTIKDWVVSKWNDLSSTEMSEILKLLMLNNSSLYTNNLFDEIIQNQFFLLSLSKAIALILIKLQYEDALFWIRNVIFLSETIVFRIVIEVSAFFIENDVLTSRIDEQWSNSIGIILRDYCLEMLCQSKIGSSEALLSLASWTESIPLAHPVIHVSIEAIQSDMINVNDHYEVLRNSICVSQIDELIEFIDQNHIFNLLKDIINCSNRITPHFGFLVNAIGSRLIENENSVPFFEIALDIFENQDQHISQTVINYIQCFISKYQESVERCIISSFSQLTNYFAQGLTEMNDYSSSLLKIIGIVASSYNSVFTSCLAAFSSGIELENDLGFAQAAAFFEVLLYAHYEFISIENFQTKIMEFMNILSNCNPSSAVQIHSALLYIKYFMRKAVSFCAEDIQMVFNSLVNIALSQIGSVETTSLVSDVFQIIFQTQNIISIVAIDSEIAINFIRTQKPAYISLAAYFISYLPIPEIDSIFSQFVSDLVNDNVQSFNECIIAFFDGFPKNRASNGLQDLLTDLVIFLIENIPLDDKMTSDLLYKLPLNNNSRIMALIDALFALTLEEESLIAICSIGSQLNDSYKSHSVYLHVKDIVSSYLIIQKEWSYPSEAARLSLTLHRSFYNLSTKSLIHIDNDTIEPIIRLSTYVLSECLTASTANDIYSFYCLSDNQYDLIILDLLLKSSLSICNNNDFDIIGEWRRALNPIFLFQLKHIRDLSICEKIRSLLIQIHLSEFIDEFFDIFNSNSCNQEKGRTFYKMASHFLRKHVDS